MNSFMISFAVGLIVEDWESGNFDQFEWETGGSADWAISNQSPYEGTFCVKSGTIGNDQLTSLTISFNVLSNGEIGFYKKVSSESTYDFLKFYIDNIVMDQWSGDVSWEGSSYPVTTGPHTFKWEYEKDQGVAGGLDCAWVDYITLPSGAMTAVYAGFTVDATTVCEGELLHYSDASLGEIVSWDWIFEGGSPETSSLQNPIIEYATSGIYDVSLTVSDCTDSHTIMMENYIHIESTLMIPGIPEGPGSAISLPGFTAEYTTSGSLNASSYNWVIEPIEAGILIENNEICTVDWTDYWVGNATLKVSSINTCGESVFSDNIVIWVIIDGVDKTASENISIFPNPTSGQLSINFGKYTGQQFDVKIINSHGKVVAEFNDLSEAGQINLEDQKAGIYFLTVTGPSVSYYEKIILH
jgi:PKD repeat protein